MSRQSLVSVHQEDVGIFYPIFENCDLLVARGEESRGHEGSPPGEILTTVQNLTVILLIFASIF